MKETIMALVGVVVGGGIGVVKDLIGHKVKLRIEKLKIHDADRVKAYKSLFVFAQRLSNESFPLAENKGIAFRTVMDGRFREIEDNYIYFSEGVRGILDEFNDAYMCMTSPDLIGEMEDHVKEFLDKKLFKLANELKELASKDSRL